MSSSLQRKQPLQRYTSEYSFLTAANMWIFLFLIALIPLFFFFTDSVGDLIPQWKHALPQKKTHIERPAEAAPASADAARRAGQPLTWVETPSERGYAAFLLSPDSQYRLVAGCQTGQVASLMLTQLSGAAITAPLVVDYEFGTLPLSGGRADGNAVLGAVSQMAKVVIRTEGGEAVTTFNTFTVSSEAISRTLAQACAR